MPTLLTCWNFTEALKKKKKKVAIREGIPGQQHLWNSPAFSNAKGVMWQIYLQYSAERNSLCFLSGSTTRPPRQPRHANKLTKQISNTKALASCSLNGIPVNDVLEQLKSSRTHE